MFFSKVKSKLTAIIRNMPPPSRRFWHNPAFRPYPTMSKPILSYLHLRPHDDLAPLAALLPSSAFLAVLVVDEVCEEMWRWDLCRRLARSHCRYLLAWGEGCADWEESASDAWLEAVDYEDVPPEQLLITTAHEDEELEEVFWFARHKARHPALQLGQAVILHIAERGRRQELEALYVQA